MRLIFALIMTALSAGTALSQEVCTVLSTTCTQTGSVEYNGYIIDDVCITQSVVHECITERENCPSSYKMGHQSGLSIGGSGSLL